MDDYDIRQLAEKLLGVSATILAATKCNEEIAARRAAKLWSHCLQEAQAALANNSVMDGDRPRAAQNARPI